METVFFVPKTLIENVFNFATLQLIKIEMNLVKSMSNAAVPRMQIFVGFPKEKENVAAI